MLLCYPGDGCRNYLVADCCNELEGHCEIMRYKRIVAEVDFNTARRWQVVGYGPRDIYVAVIRAR